MTSRFDNLPTEEILQIELQCRIDRLELTRLIRERFQAEAEQVYQFGKAYRIKSGRFAGRAMILEYIVAGCVAYTAKPEPYFPLAEGRLSIPHGMRSWTTKTQQVRLENLDPASGFDPQLKRK